MTEQIIAHYRITGKLGEGGMLAEYSVHGREFAAARPSPWSEVRIRGTGAANNYAVAPDGKRILGAPKTQAPSAGGLGEGGVLYGAGAVYRATLAQVTRPHGPLCPRGEPLAAARAGACAVAQAFVPVWFLAREADRA